MSVKEKLVRFGKKQSFQPNFLSLFINPFFFIRRALYKKVKAAAPKLKGRLLDFGCGRKPYRDLFEVDEYIGIDIQVSGHDHVESEVDVYYDGKVIPFENESFDSLFCSEVLEHVFNIDEVLPEMKRILKIDGVGLFTIPLAWGEHEQPFDFGRYTSFGIKHVFEKHGFLVLDIQKSNHFSEALIQLWILYIFTFFKGKNRYLNTLITFVILSPLNIIGLFFSKILPKNYDYYNNLVVTVKKVAP